MTIRVNEYFRTKQLTTAFDLMIPPMSKITDESQTIAEAKLQNSVLIVKLK